MDQEVTLTPKGLRWRRQGHPWIYRDDLKEADPSLSGQIVRVKASSTQPLGQAFFHGSSKIALRWLTDDLDAAIDRTFWAARLQAAIDYRKRLFHEAALFRETSAFRLIYSEADGFPGLIVDRYGEFLVLQTNSLGMDRVVPLMTDLLIERIQPKAILARNDSQVRVLEGLPLEKKLLYGDRPDRVEVQESDRRYLVDVWEGQKTGAYLDQRENRLWARNHARGRVLDAFAYQGAFSLQVAPQAEEVLAIEDSQAAVSVFKENLALNQFSNVRVERDNAFDRLRALEKEGQRFDLIVLDPPAFARARQDLIGAWRGYREINLRALKLLNRDGVLISCSCSYNLSEEDFLSILREAAWGLKRTVRFVESRTQSRDHPILLTHPESKYLKVMVVEAA